MSAVRVRLLEVSSVRLTSPVLSELIVPVKDESFARFMVRLEMESTTMLPEVIWLVRFRVTAPPLLPDLPQESCLIRRKLPVWSLFMIWLFSRLMVAVVLVT